ncbi:putative phospholipase B-like 1 [Lycorma delicatula]|uniref:putative phospholipase B-like 1 n=1 Tax=Lycorma delicatula TaxID=130591 RepID=UPI003F515370
MLCKLLTVTLILQSYLIIALTENQFITNGANNVLISIQNLNTDGNNVRAEAKKSNEIICYAQIQKTGNITGWNLIKLWTNPKFDSNLTSYYVGYCEGGVGTELTAQYWFNTVRTFCDNQKEICNKIKDFIKENTVWVEEMITININESEYWWQVNLVYQQLKGFAAGYNYCKKPNEPEISYEDILFMNMRGDMYDLVDKFRPAGSIPSKIFDEGHCSAIIKLLPKNTDLYVAHNTWTRYNTMTRVLKLYELQYNKLRSSETVISGNKISFSSYPGVIHSIDDFYTTSSGLVVQETTIGNNNNDLWKYVTPNGTVFEFIRIMVANRLGSDGKSWSSIFSQYNSGTYNNQWMVVDYKKFTPGKPPKNGLLWILEQIPGHINAKDQTSLLKKQTYWPSYNIPFYKDVFKLSGYDKLVSKYGKWFSYDGAPRAKIMKRDHKKIKTMDSLMSFMRSNDYKHDPLSSCECSPPYSASNAIAARHDLNPANGTYPIPYLGHRSGGATDAKLTNSTLIKTLQFVAVSGPTAGTNLPVFKWSTSDFKDTVSHLGQPDEWNFEPIVTSWVK